MVGQRIESDNKFEVDIEFRYQTKPNLSHGFAIMFQEEAPQYPRDFKEVDHNYGFKAAFKGLGVFLHRSERDNKWYVFAVQNNGLAGVTEGKTFESLITPKNSC